MQIDRSKEHLVEYAKVCCATVVTARVEKMQVTRMRIVIGFRIFSVNIVKLKGACCFCSIFCVHYTCNVWVFEHSVECKMENSM